MKRLLYFLQFLPLSIFIGTARSHGFTSDSWNLAFQYGALAGIFQLIILLPILKNKLGRLMAGVNAFLIVGGTAFFFNNEPLLSFVGWLKESGLIFFVSLVCLLATLFTDTGIFEEQNSKQNLEKKFSFYYLGGIAIALTWSLLNRGSVSLAGVVPFVFLNFLKSFFEKKLKTV